MRILVTGGCGFIGSNFIRYVLRNRDYEITNVDALTYAARPEALEEIVSNVSNERYKFIKADIRDEIAMQKAMAKADFVVNFAAETHVDRSIGSWESEKDMEKRWEQQYIFADTNVKGTQVLLEVTKKLEIKKFIQISTDEVYGSVKSPRSEECTLNPGNPYSASKAGAEHYVNAYFHTHNLPICITRSSNNFGPWQGSEKFIPVVILRALANKEIPVYGVGQNIRDWIFVEDNIAAILSVLERGKPGETYNIATGNERTNIELARQILRLIGKPESLIRFVKDRPGHDLRYSMDCSKIQGEIGWNPLRDLESGLRETIKFYTKYQDYFRKDQEKSRVDKRIKALLGK